MAVLAARPLVGDAVCLQPLVFTSLQIDWEAILMVVPIGCHMSTLL